MSRWRAGDEIELAVESLGAAGDGVASTLEGRIYLPDALPGERWRVRLAERLPEGWRAEPLACLVPQPRAEPVCPHFGRCGGCRLQHLPRAAYADFKRDRIVRALERRGLPAASVTAAAIAPLASRRRLRLKIARGPGELQLGLRRRGAHELERMTVCPIACPELAGILAPLARGLGRCLEAPLPEEVSLTMTATGLDLLLHANRWPRPGEREHLPGLAASLDLARVSWAAQAAAPEPLAVRRQPEVWLAGVPVELPPGAFLQASAFGEARLADAVAAWSAGCRHAVDLFAGVGTLTFAIDAAARSLRALEADPHAAQALKRAAVRAGRTRITVETRDLDRRPLAGPELERADLAVLDPPRAGAPAQVRSLAAAGQPATVIYASCHPESFARDARVLVEGGFVLEEVRPIDQFLFSAEVELAALFLRPRAGHQKRA